MKSRRSFCWKFRSMYVHEHCLPKLNQISNIFLHDERKSKSTRMGLKLYKIYLIWHSYGEYGNQIEQKLHWNRFNMFFGSLQTNIQFCWKNMHKMFFCVCMWDEQEHASDVRWRKKESKRRWEGKEWGLKIEDAPWVQNVIYCVYVAICRRKANPNRQTTKQQHQHHHHE